MSNIFNILILLLTSCFKTDSLDLKQKVLNNKESNVKVIEYSKDLNWNSMLKDNLDQSILVKAKEDIYLNDEIKVDNIKIKANRFVNNNSVKGDRTVIRGFSEGTECIDASNLNFKHFKNESIKYLDVANANVTKILRDKKFLKIETEGTFYLNNSLEAKALKIETDNFINNNLVEGEKLTIKNIPTKKDAVRTDLIKSIKVIKSSQDIDLGNVLKDNNLFNEEFVSIKSRGDVYLNNKIKVKELKIRANKFTNRGSLVGDTLIVKSSLFSNTNDLKFRSLKLNCSKIFNSNVEDNLSIEAEDLEVVTNYIENHGKIKASQMNIISKELNNIKIVNKDNMYLLLLKIESLFDIVNYGKINSSVALLDIKSLDNRGYIGSILLDVVSYFSSIHIDDLDKLLGFIHIKCKEFNNKNAGKISFCMIDTSADVIHQLMFSKVKAK